MDHSYKRANIVAVEAKTSVDICRKAQQAIDGRQEYAKFLERKKQLSEETKAEKRKDLELLKSYKPPWWDHGHKNEYSKKQEAKTVKEEEFPDCLGFGKPGNGAPLRSDSGNVKAVLKSDPETRFQKRERQQTLDVLEPSLGHRLRNPRTSSINVLGQRKWIRPGNVAPLPTTPCDIFGQPLTRSEQRPIAARNATKRQRENSVALEDENAGIRTKADAPTKMVAGEVERSWGEVENRRKHQPVTAVEKAQGHGGNEKTEDDFFDPWGRAGGGAPNRDVKGNLVKQKKKGELVASFKKSEEEKELERKEMEVKMAKNNADNNADVTYIENGNYYRMHLDAQRNNVVFPPATQSTKANKMNMGNVKVVDAPPKQPPTRRFTLVVRDKVLPGVRKMQASIKESLKENKKQVQSQLPADSYQRNDDDGGSMDKSYENKDLSDHQNKMNHNGMLSDANRYVPSAYEKQRSEVLPTENQARSSPSNKPQKSTNPSPVQHTSTEKRQAGNSEGQGTEGHGALEANHRSKTMVREEDPQHDIRSPNSEDMDRFSSPRIDLGDDSVPPLRPTTPSQSNTREEKKGPVLSESLKRKITQRRTSQI